MSDKDGQLSLKGGTPLTFVATDGGYRYKEGYQALLVNGSLDAALCQNSLKVRRARLITGNVDFAWKRVAGTNLPNTVVLMHNFASMAGSPNGFCLGWDPQSDQFILARRQALGMQVEWTEVPV